MFRRVIRGPRIAVFAMCWLVAAGVLAIGAGAGAAAEGDLVRVVVQLDDPALAQYRDTLPGLKGVLDARTPKGHLDVKAPASRAYLKHLGDKQKDFEGKLKDAAPNAAVQWHYDTAFNGMTIEVPRDRIDAIRCRTSSRSARRTSSIRSSTKAGRCSGCRRSGSRCPLTSGWPDVVAASSSRGPATTMGIKPDIAAPGSSILSSSVTDSTGAVNPSALFEQLTGTSMSTPHITALGGLLKLKHPDWTPAQVKSALMNTAETRMSLDLEGTVPALAKHRGAGRVNAARLANVQLTFDPPSVSFGLMHPSETKRITIAVTDMRDSGGATGFSLNVRQIVGNAAVSLTPTPTFTTTAGDSTSFNVDLATSSAPAGDYEGFLEITGGGQTYTIPYFVRVQDASVAKDVLLIDWDRNLAGADFRPAYTAALEGLGLSFDVFDGGAAATGNAGPTFAQLQNYRSVVLFTGNNATSWSAGHVGGSFPLENYLVTGGKIVLSGQDFNSQYAYDQNAGSDYLYSQMSGWLTGNVFGPVPAAGPPCPATQSDRDFYGTGALNPTTAQLETAFTLLGHTGDVSTNLGGNGAGNQRFPDAGRTIREADTLDQCTEPYNGAKVEPHARVLGRYTTTKKDGTAVPRVTESVATGVAGDPTLGRLDPLVTWNAALLHVGLEGLNANRGELSSQSALELLYDFVTDSVSAAVTHKVHAARVDFVAQASSASGSEITMYRWDFGDGSPFVETTEPTVTHDYGKGSRGTYTAYVEAVNALTRSGVASTTVTITRR